MGRPGRQVRLVARRRGAEAPDPGRPARRVPLGRGREERAGRQSRTGGGSGEDRMSRLRGEAGLSLVEMLVVLVILGVVLGGIATLFEQGTKAELDMNFRFQAQQDARVALDRMRRDLHCASVATSSSSTSQTFTDPCVTGSTLTWCVVSANGRQGLYRQAGAGACNSSSQKFADYLRAGST